MLSCVNKGDYIVYRKLCLDGEGLHLYNMTLINRFVTYGENDLLEGRYVTITNDAGDQEAFMLGSQFGNCFVNLNEERRTKLKKLNVKA